MKRSNATDTPGVRVHQVAGPLRPLSHAPAHLAAALGEWLAARARELGGAPEKGSQVFVQRCTVSVEVKDGAPKGRKYWVQAWLGVRAVEQGSRDQ